MLVYSFVPLGDATGAGNLGFGPGGRDIFYLRKEAGEWRTACDIWMGCVDPVETGPHPNFRRNLSRFINEDIIEILYSRGEGVSDRQMIDALRPRNQGFRWGQDAYVRQLEEMAKVETPPVRAVVCQIQASGPDGEPCPAQRKEH